MTASTLRIALVATLLALAGMPVAAQPFEAGPPGMVVGSSMANPELRGLPSSNAPRIPNAHVFGDTVEERAWGRDFDDSHLKPQVRRPVAAPPIASRAREGRPDLDPARAGAFARSGPAAIGGSSITRPPPLGARHR